MLERHVGEVGDDKEWKQQADGVSSSLQKLNGSKLLASHSRRRTQPLAITEQRDPGSRNKIQGPGILTSFGDNHTLNGETQELLHV